MKTGWLFDAYALDDKIILWIKDNKTIHRIEKQWTPSLYVSSGSKYKLSKLATNQTIKPFVKECFKVKKFEQASDLEKSNVLQIIPLKSSEIVKIAKHIERLDVFGAFRLYNVDIPPEQTYLYENNLYPLGKYQIKNNLWTELSDIGETDYELPTFTNITLEVHPEPTHKIPRFADRIKRIQINDTVINSDSESQMILDCVKIIQEIDPDFIFTNNGDTWDFPYLAYRATKNKISDKLVFGREPDHTVMPPKQKGTSYFSYGQIHYKPFAIKLLGRIHIDKSNCFIWEHEHSIQGLYEIARTCRLPLQTAARASIGKCMSSVQFHNALQRDLLIPWKPTLSEIFKTRRSLFVGDRGGLILEPRIGVHENVGEIDFASLFGNIMLQKNISAETIDCRCCPDSESFVPELGYHICKRRGIVPQSLEILLRKRQMYSDLIKTTTTSDKMETYKQRKAALKWILVTSFGYLGFNNAKFGLIDAHMAVCAFARKLLLEAIHIAEEHGFKILHGIVDSIWVQKNNATQDDYDTLRKKIVSGTGFDMSLEIYNWIVFLSSKENKMIPVPNRYFGANKNGKLKMRGIETRRHDTPEFFNKCQKQILGIFASCRTKSEIEQSLDVAQKIKEHYKRHLLQNEVPINDLVFTNRVTRGTGQHKSNTVQSDAVNQLKWEGKTIQPGQKIQYIINDYSRKISKRVIPIDMSPDKYDAKKYSSLLDDYCHSIMEPFIQIHETS